MQGEKDRSDEGIDVRIDEKLDKDVVFSSINLIVDVQDDTRDDKVANANADQPQLQSHSVTLLISIAVEVPCFGVVEKDEQARDEGKVVGVGREFGNVRIGNRLIVVLAIPVSFGGFGVDVLILETPARFLEEGEQHVESER